MGWLRNLFGRNDDIERDLPERIRKYSDAPLSACSATKFRVVRPSGGLPLTAEPGAVMLDENGQVCIWDDEWRQIRNDPMEDTLAEAVAGSVEKAMEPAADGAVKRGEKKPVMPADSGANAVLTEFKKINVRKSGSTASGPIWFETMQKAKETELLAPWFRNSS